MALKKTGYGVIGSYYLICTLRGRRLNFVSIVGTSLLHLWTSCYQVFDLFKHNGSLKIVAACILRLGGKISLTVHMYHGKK
jgi:hypothetical protein